MATRILVDGMTVSIWRAIPALRMRVSMSAMGSAMNGIGSLLLLYPTGFSAGDRRCQRWSQRWWSRPPHQGASPHLVRDPAGRLLPVQPTLRLETRLGDAWQTPGGRQLAEANPASAELPHVGARPAADLAPVIIANRVLRGPRGLRDHRLLGHLPLRGIEN